MILSFFTREWYAENEDSPPPSDTEQDSRKDIKTTQVDVQKNGTGKGRRKTLYHDAAGKL